MTFFSSEKLASSKIEIDLSSTCSDSPEVRKRLDRIEVNYQKLHLILAEMESKMQTDERLKAIDDASVDFEQTFGIKKKRKWRPVKPKSKRRVPRSNDPQKPR